MKHPPLLLLPLLAAFMLNSCVVPGDYQTGVSTVGVSYGSYATLPPGYAGESYYHGGRYYSGGRYEHGRYHDHGRAYTNRYYHDGRYYYGGRHEHHGTDRPVNYGAPRQQLRDEYDDRRQPSWQSNHPGQPFSVGGRGM